jgi:dipeptidyl aminopeptidase/acylaminoacyl peptidase
VGWPVVSRSEEAPSTTRPAAVPLRPYEVNPDAPLDALEKIEDHNDRLTRLRVEFNGIKSDRVPAYLYVPNDDQAKHPALLLQYGSGGNKSTFYIVALAREFAARGFVVLTIDVPNRGERRKRRDLNAGFLTMMTGGGDLLRQTMGDYGRAIDYLTTRPEVDASRIGYAGISLGAITGIPFVAHDPRIKAMASVVGGGNFLGFLKGGPLAPETQAIVERLDPFYHVGLIAPRPLLLLNVMHDQLVPRFFGESLQRAAGEGAVRMWFDTDHFFRTGERDKALQTLVDFLQKQLNDAAK